MLHPSSLIRLAVWGGVALLVRSIVREANDVRPASGLLPPPGGLGKSRTPSRKPPRTKAAKTY